MAYDADGNWIAEDDTVESRVTGVLAKGSPLITQAQTAAKQEANRRGLLNTSMAVTAGTDAAIRTALPIASQDASQIHAKNLSRQGAAQTTSLAEGQQAHEAGLQTAQIAHQASERVGGQEHQAALQTTKQEHELTSQQKAQAHQASTQAANIAAQKEIQTAGSESQLKLQEIGIAADAAGAELNRDAQARIAGMNVAASDREKAISAAVAIEATYSAALANIAVQEDIPSQWRDKYNTHLAAVRDSGLSMIENMYNVEVVWSSPVMGLKN